MRKIFTSKLIAVFLAVVMSVSLCTAFVPVTAHAVTQDQVDALKARRDQLIAQREAKQQEVEALEEEQASIVEMKKAMDERNQYTLEQMQLNSEEIALYNDMIEEKAREVEEAKRLEKEQLERYRSRVRAMEENGKLNLLALVLNANDLGEFLTAIDKSVVKQGG